MIKYRTKNKDEIANEIFSLICEIKSNTIDCNINDIVFLTGSPLYLSAVELVYFVYRLEEKYGFYFSQEELLDGKVNQLSYLVDKIQDIEQS